MPTEERLLLAEAMATSQEALLREWTGGRACLAEALRGASRFAAGQGRHGEFK